MDAYEISKEAKCKKNQNGNWQAFFEINLSGRKNNKVLQEDNALFYQIKQCLGLKEEADLSETVLYVDFDIAFNKKNDQCVEFTHWKNLQELTESELKNSVINKLRWVFYNGQGISISLDGSSYKTYVPFERSSSMTKSFKLTFIDKEILIDLNKRLMLGLDCNTIANEIDINKYWSYRGLYLSTAQRVNINEFKLDEESVIVLKDGYADSEENFSIFTAELSNNDLWEPCLKTDKDANVNEYRKIDKAFDGQGLIDNNYSMLLNEFLKKIGMIKVDREEAHSFQIRMPFTKGMLHEVAFHEFVEEFILPKEDTLTEPIRIKDIYGIERDISKVHIILTQSMFKCYKWLKLSFYKLSDADRKVYNHDPMKFYFTNFKKYNHALYIRECDSNIRNVGWVQTNKQFLSTLKLNNKMLDAIIQKHTVRMDNLTNALKHNKANYDIRVDDIWAKAINAVRLNDAFISDNTVKEIIKNLENNYRKNICLGALEVEGENRYLARDLMMLLLSLYFQCSGFNKEYKLNKYKLSRNIKCLSSDQCYLAGNRVEYKLYDKVGILRNPHLSRPEQCLLSTFNSNLYKNFFGHLKNVVMIGYHSLAANTLGGADFDGDIVKVFNSTSPITEAIKNGINDEKNQRKLPIIIIPSPISKAQSEKHFDTPSFDIVYNTFCNEIGVISNIALRLAGDEYTDCFDGDYSKTEDKLAELCTIVTGLEIDSSKTGIRPEANKKALKNQDKIIRHQKYFEDANNFFSSNNYKHFTPIVEQEDDDVYVLYCNTYKNKIAFRAKWFSDCDTAPILEQLPGRYLKYLYEKQSYKQDENNQDNITLSSQNDVIYFDFQVNPNWKREYIESEKQKIERKELEKNRIDCVQQLVTSYLSVVGLISGENKINWKCKDIDFILNAQYDDIDSTQLPGYCDLTISRAKEYIYKNLLKNLSSKDIKNLMDKIKTTNTWQFVSKNERMTELKCMLKLDNYDDVNYEVYQILCNFNYGGYKLLYLFLEQVYIDLKNDNKSKEVINKSNYAKEMLSRYKIINEKFKKDNDTNKLSKTMWNRDLIQYCRDELHKLYDNDITEAIKAVMCSGEKYKMKFVWNVFEFNEIKRYIPKKEKGSEAVDAGRK